MHFVLSPAPRTQRYRVESAARLGQGGRLLEYHEVTQLELTLLGADADAWVFRLRTQDVQLRSNNELFQWTRDVNALLDELVLRVGPEGRVRGVLNEADLLARWPAHRQQLAQAYGARPGAADMLTALDQALHTPGFVHNHLAQHGLSDFLFPGLYGRYGPEPPTVPKVLPNFFGALDLPLRVQHRATADPAPGQAVAVHTLGQLDEAQLDADGFRRLLKDATDTYDIKTDLVADYETTYSFDSQHWPQAAELFLAVEAGGSAFQYALGRQLTTLPA